jgi:hypothetical protein
LKGIGPKYASIVESRQVIQHLVTTLFVVGASEDDKGTVALGAIVAVVKTDQLVPDGPSASLEA